MTEVRFDNASITLVGELTLPVATAPTAGVVLVGGSGATDRHNDTLFAPIREHLNGSGIAVLSYDKRGVGSSTGDWQDATIDDLASDAIAAADFLRAQSQVRDDAVGLLGHSEGGWVALRAAREADLAFVVVNGCPGVTPARQDRFALATAVVDEQIAEDDRRALLARYDEMVDAGRGDAVFADVADLFTEGTPALDDYLGPMTQSEWEFLKRKQDHDPLPDLRALHRPLLALFGSADRMVPVGESVAAYSTAVCDVDRPAAATVTIDVVPGGNHRGRIEGTDGFVPGFLRTISDWVIAQTTA